MWFRAVEADESETELMDLPGECAQIIGAQLDVVDASKLRDLRQGMQIEPHPIASCARGRHIGFEPPQRSQAVESGALGVGLTEGIVEDLKRHRSGITGQSDASEEVREIPGALTGEHAVVAGPAEDVHR